jgi:hypothetical protein
MCLWPGLVVDTRYINTVYRIESVGTDESLLFQLGRYLSDFIPPPPGGIHIHYYG